MLLLIRALIAFLPFTLQPRVLSIAQVAALKGKVQDWSEKVKSSMLFVEDKTRELFA